MFPTENMERGGHQTPLSCLGRRGTPEMTSEININLRVQHLFRSSFLGRIHIEIIIAMPTDKRIAMVIDKNKDAIWEVR